jgi:hypothetical protein
LEQGHELVMPARVHIFVPIFAIAIGFGMLVIGTARPAFVWDIGQIRVVREFAGDQVLAALYVIIGALALILGACLLIKR